MQENVYTYYVNIILKDYFIKTTFQNLNLKKKFSSKHKSNWHYIICLQNEIYTVVGDNINIMKTTFEFNFDSYQAFKQHVNTKVWKQRKAVNLRSFTLITCKLVIRKKLVNN